MSGLLERSVTKAMRDSDHWVLKIRYEAKNGDVHDRFVSPIRYEADGRFLALCLCREEPRLFSLDRCLAWRLVKAEEVLMPVEIVPVQKAVAGG